MPRTFLIPRGCRETKKKVLIFNTSQQVSETSWKPLEGSCGVDQPLLKEQQISDLWVEDNRGIIGDGGGCLSSELVGMRLMEWSW